ncbi:hypothetical protein [Methanobrevibacter sp.]|uniref:hypothetical protein n=1 Tax=Methanobrevibacter sp. TaxID=66852 RepID=UPI0025DDF156|nr:hypothetical protein [Methanobrevibacter sp.]MBR4448312.1 Ig-like domain repeat protein [Methanobrevibacter sp.]
MKINKLFLLTLFVIALFALSAVSASDDVNATDNSLQATEDDELSAGVDIYTDTDDGEFVVGEDDTITVEIPEGTTGELTVSINGTPARLYYDEDMDEDGYIYLNHSKATSTSLPNLPYEDDIDEDEGIAEYEISLDKLPVGKTYKVLVKFVTSSKTYSKSFTIKLLGEGGQDPDDDVDIDVEDSYLFNKSTNVINITAPKSIIGNLDIKINGKSYDLNLVSDTMGFINISKLEIGEYTIVVNWDGDSTEDYFEVVAIHWPETLVYGSSGYVTFNSPDSVAGNFTVTIDGNIVGRVKVEKGYAQVLIANLSAGTHEIKAEYPTEGNETDEVEGEMEVMPKITIPSEMTVGEDKYLIIEVGNTTGVAHIQADFENYATVNVKGITRISLKNLEDGVVTISLNYVSGAFEFDEDYDILVNPVPIKIVSNDVSVFYTQGGALNVKVYGTNGKLADKEDIQLKLGKKTYWISTNKNGIATFKIPGDLAPGKYQITVKYEDGVVKSAIVVKHILKLKKAKVKKSGKKLVLKATLKYGKKPIKGKEITFKFKGKKYVAKTNKKGVAKVKIKKSVLKKLKVGKKVKCRATYLKDTVKKSVKVKK